MLGILSRLCVRAPALCRAFHRSPCTMVEGHQCHRTGHAHRKQLLGKAFKATSPNGRFAEGASAIDGRPLTRIEVHGKNLFYFFGDPAVVLHFHFGMAGRFSTHSLPGPEATATTRLQLVNQDAGLVALLSAMTVQHGDTAFYEVKRAGLGEDPLREDASVERVWAKVAASKKPIGLLLMDQSVIAGIGNIYRAEILFKSGLHPEIPGNAVSREAFDQVWRHSVLLLQRGFQSGSILTVDPEEAAVLGKPWTRRYIYNHTTCGRCKGQIRSWDMAARTCYACEGCQPMPAGLVLSPARAKALKGGGAAQQFVSHCAPDPASEAPPGKMAVATLRAALGALGLPAKGNKAELVARLQAAQAGEGTAAAAAAAAAATAVAADANAPVVATPAPKTPKRRRGGAATAAQRQQQQEKEEGDGGEAAVFPELYAWDHTAQQATSEATVVPGTQGLGEMASPKAAALEKLAAGEGRQVEHVALQDDATAALAAPKRRRGGKM